MFAKILFFINIVLSSAFLPNYNTPLQKIATNHIVVSSLRRKLSIELLDANNVIGFVGILPNTHSWLFLTGGITISTILIFSHIISQDVNQKRIYAYKTDKFRDIEKRVNLGALVFMLIMTKNIQNAI
jgi:hypothetical protein